MWGDSVRFLIVFIFFSLFLPMASAWAGESKQYGWLKVFYLEFPPYYYTAHDGRPDGFLLKKADAIFRKAGIEPRYESLSAKRILQEMRTVEPVCSIGWFKTPQRERFAQFSRPIYQNKPLEAMFLKKNAQRFADKETLSELLLDERLALGLVGGYSLGQVVDGLIAESAANPRLVAGGYPQLVRMLAAERFSYLIVAPEEADTLVRKNYLAPDLFQVKALSDVPAGNYRYFMFSKAVSKSLVSRIDRAILSVEKNR